MHAARGGRGASARFSQWVTGGRQGEGGTALRGGASGGRGKVAFRARANGAAA